jgi:carbon monoxide dehydrogenase subunit G
MHLDRQIAIHAPAAMVWRCLTEFDLRKRWMAQLVSEDIENAEPRGVGSVATVRLLQNNKIVTYRSTVIDWDPGRKLSVGMTGGTLPPDIVMGVIYELTPGDEAGATILKYDFHMPVKGFFLRMIKPLIRIGVGQVVDRDHAQLKALAEKLAAEPSGE